MVKTKRGRVIKQIATLFITAGALVSFMDTQKVEAATVNFNSMGGSGVASKNVNTGSQLGPLTTPTKANYYFEGWYTAATGGSRVYSTTIMRAAAPRTYTVKAGQGPYRIFMDYAYNKGFTGTREQQEQRFRVVNGWNANAYPSVIQPGQVIIVEDPNLASTVTYYARWSPGITINYNGNGGTSPARKVIKSGQSVGTLPTSTRTGHAFKGWFNTTAATGGTQLYSSTVFSTRSPRTYTVVKGDSWYAIARKILNDTSKVEQLASWNGKKSTDILQPGQVLKVEDPKTLVANYTYYARWAVIRTIKYDANDGKSGVIKTWTGEHNTALGTLPTPTRTGYKLLGWYTSKTGGTKISSSTKATANTTYYAQWQSDIKITFNANGGTTPSTASKLVNHGDPIGALPTTTRTNYTFNGWYTAPTGGTKITGNTIATKSVEYYAQWVENLTVKFDAQGGTAVQSQRIPANGKILTIPVPTRLNYVFSGWYTQTGGKGTRLTTTTVISQNITYYAAWDRAYNITFNAQGGTGGPGVIQVIEGGVIGSLPLVTKEGFRFEGWYTQAGGAGTKVTPNRQPTKDEVYYANYIQQVTVNFRDGQTILSTKNVDINTSIGALPTYNNKEGEVFKGWMASQGNSIVDASYIVTRNTDFIAIVNKQVKIVFNTEDGKPIQTITLESGDELPEVTLPTKENYVFKGWYTNTLGTGPVYVTGAVVYEDLVLYANWGDSEFILSFDTDGGTPVEPIYLLKGEAIGLDQLTTKLGSRFEGWYTEPDLINKVPNLYTPTKNMRLYAKWYKVPVYEITFNTNVEGQNVAPKYLNEDTAIDKLPTPKRVGYGFLGWYEDQALTKQVYEGAIPNRHMVLHAKWAKQSEIVDVIFNAENGSSEITRNAEKGKTLPVSYYFTPYKKDMVFRGWYTQRNGKGTQVTQSTVYNATTRLYGKWENRDDYSAGKLPTNPINVPNINPGPWVPKDYNNDYEGVQIDEDIKETITRTDDVIYLDEARTWLETVRSVTKSNGYRKEVVFGEEGARSIAEPILNAEDYTNPDDTTAPTLVFGS